MSTEDGSRILDWWLRGIDGAIRQLHKLLDDGIPREEKNIVAAEYLKQELGRIVDKIHGFSPTPNPLPQPWKGSNSG